MKTPEQTIARMERSRAFIEKLESARMERERAFIEDHDKCMKESRQFCERSSVEFRLSGFRYVYFMTAGPFVKIGCCGRSPYDRMAELQVACPYELRLACCFIGGFGLERSMHSLWAKYRAEAGEWFRLEGELAEFVAQHELRFLSDVAAFAAADDAGVAQ